jgi:hypothetical protein
MGKSPAKWIKSVLFGKRSSSRSGSTKAKDLSVRYSYSSVVSECSYDFELPECGSIYAAPSKE